MDSTNPFILLSPSFSYTLSLLSLLFFLFLVPSLSEVLFTSPSEPLKPLFLNMKEDDKNREVVGGG